jgi:hypothetical protein
MGATMVRTVLVLAFGLAVTQGVALAADYGLPPQSSPVLEANPFLGGYAALGGSYGVGSPRRFSVSSPRNNFVGFPSDDGLSGDASPAGWSGVAVAGYNMTFGPALIGIELDGRWGEEKFTQANKAANNNGIAPVGTISYGYTFKNDAGLHLSARLGAVFGDTLIFGKLGAGASRIRDEFATDQTTAIRCSSINVFVVPNVCTGPTPGGTGSYAQTRWAPSLILGVGAERNIGAFFLRAGVEAETLAQDAFSFTQPTANGWSFSGSVSSPNTQWAVRASAMAGVRF